MIPINTSSKKYIQIHIYGLFDLIIAFNVRLNTYIYHIIINIVKNIPSRFSQINKKKKMTVHINEYSLKVQKKKTKLPKREEEFLYRVNITFVFVFILTFGWRNISINT